MECFEKEEQELFSHLVHAEPAETPPLVTPAEGINLSLLNQSSLI